MVYGEYKSKLVSAEQAVKVVKSGDWVDFNSFNGLPLTLEAALAERRDELVGVKLRGSSAMRPLKCVENDPDRKHFIYHSYFFSKYERQLHDRDLCNHIPVAFHERDSYYDDTFGDGIETDVYMLQVCPMNEYGYFNFGPQVNATRKCTEMAKIVIAEVNNLMPVALGGRDEMIHVSEVDYIVEGDDFPLLEIPPPRASEVEKAIAKHLIAEIHEGCCIQLGIGGLPNQIGEMIAKSGIKHLGVHTEMLNDSFVDMYKAGCIDGSKKVVDRFRMTYSFALGSKKLYDFIDNNPICAISPGIYINNPNVIAQNPNMRAINNALEIDLFGQVSSESVGSRQISGTGGQWDFMKGAYMSPGGKGYICLSSTKINSDGSEVSRITPTLSPGTIVTTPRWSVHYIATEFGIVKLKGASTWERAERLISIAHPNFQEELIKEAQRMKVWRRSNRI